MCKMARFGNCDPETADQEYCIFHKPDKSEEEAVEFYRKFLERFKPRVEEIEVEERKVKRFVFEKPVDARGFVFSEIPDGPIKYKDENGNRWDEKFSFERTIIPFGTFKEARFGQVNFNYSKFGQVDFSGAEFEKAHFQGVEFKRAVFNNVKFREGIFRKAVFETVAFRKARFKKGNFNKARFNKSSFNETQFTDAYFAGSKFEGDTYFKKAKIFRNAMFKGSVFAKKADFSDCYLRNAYFMNATIARGIFMRTTFVDARFTNSILDFASFRNAVFKKANFRGAKFGKIDFEDSIFKKSLVLADVHFEKNISILHKLDTSYLLERFHNPQPLSEAARIQRIMHERIGDKELADQVFVLEMRARRHHRLLSEKEKLFHARGFTKKLKALIKYITTWIGVQTEKVLADWITEYGTNWRRILTSSGVVIFGAGILYWRLSKISERTLFGIPIGTIYTNGTSEGISGFLNALYYSLVTFTTLSYGDMHPTGWLKALSAIEALTGAVFMALIVAVIARKWMR